MEAIYKIVNFVPLLLSRRISSSKLDSRSCFETSLLCGEQTQALNPIQIHRSCQFHQFLLNFKSSLWRLNQQLTSKWQGLHKVVQLKLLCSKNGLFLRSSYYSGEKIPRSFFGLLHWHCAVCQHTISFTFELLWHPEVRHYCGHHHQNDEINIFQITKIMNECT